MNKHFFGAVFLVLSATANAADTCGTTPYAITTAGGTVQITFSLPPGLKSDVAKPDKSLTAGLTFVRYMMAMLGPSIYRELIDFYGCKLKASVESDATKSQAEKAAIILAWDKAVIDINNTAAGYFAGFRASPVEMIGKGPTATDGLNPVNWNLPAPYVKRLVQDEFLIGTSYSTYVKGSINGISGTACGEYLRGALAQNAGIIQPVAASVLPMLNKYFNDSPIAVQSAKSDLFITISSMSNVAVAPQEAAVKAKGNSCAAAS